MKQSDGWKIGGREFTSRFILGSGKYSLELIEAAVEQAGAQESRRRQPCGRSQIKAAPLIFSIISPKE